MITLFFLAFQVVLPAQSRQRAASAADFLKDPGGIKLATLVAGRTYPTGSTREGHVEATLEGWIFARSTEPTTREGFDLTVVAGGGENLRDAPGGALVARLQEGTLLDRLETRGGWIRVRRAGWVPSRGLAREVAASPPPPAPVAAPTTAGSGDSTPRPDTAATVAANPARPDPDVAATASLKAGARIAGTQDGAPIATMNEAAEAQVLGRSGNWVRVRVEGWVRTGDLAALEAVSPRITAAMLRESPDRFTGQSVAWRLQFLAVQEADALRPEMPAGQLYILARGPLPETGFVYLMVNRDQADAFRRLNPLDEVAVEAVIRASRTRYLPTPVLELSRIVR